MVLIRLAYHASLWRLLTLLLLCVSCGEVMAAASPKDSIVYVAPTGYYHRYVRSEPQAPMRLLQLFTPDEYRAWCWQQGRPLEPDHVVGADSLLAKGVPPLLQRRPASLARPKFSFNITGTTSLSLEYRTQQDDNPALPESMRRRSWVHFDKQVNIRAQAKYGDHLTLDLGYNTESTIAGRQRAISLTYQGNRYDPIRRLQVGDISFLSNNPLIATSTPLFGIYGEVDMGRLQLKSFVSRRESATRRIQVQAGRSMRTLRVRGSQYEANRHFFLSEFFAQRYDAALRSLPLVQSGIHIDNVVVWVSTRRGAQQREHLERVAAIAALSIVSDTPPTNSLLTTDTPSEIIEGARRLPPTAYRVNAALGYISLLQPLADDEVLMVSYEYTLEGRRHRVGEQQANSDGVTSAALLAARTKDPSSPLWSLTMRNAYSIPASLPLHRDALHLSIVLRDYQNGIEQLMTSEGQSWSTLFGIDKVNAQGEAVPDHRFDYIEGATIDPELGTLFLPRRTPLESVPRQVEGAPVFGQLYTHTPATLARYTDLDRFVLLIDVMSSSTSTISLEGGDLQFGTVTVVSGGRYLQEGSDYTVDYQGGTLTLASNAVAASEMVEVLIEERNTASLLRKTMMGAEAEYTLLPQLKLGATLLDYRERGIRRRVRLGEEPLHNRMLGLHLDYHVDLPRLTDWLDHITPAPLTKPSSFGLRAAYARLIPSLTADKEGMLLDDFEETTTAYDLLDTRQWRLASVPYGFDPATAIDRRALLSWFTVDPALLHLSIPNLETEDPFVRTVSHHDFYPGRVQSVQHGAMLHTATLSYYPSERGPYNLESDALNAQGLLTHPEQSWGGIMRLLPTPDLEQAHVAYLEMWLLDPFITGEQHRGGRLHIDLGDLSEEILPDQSLAYENGMVPEIPSKPTIYGAIPGYASQNYAFDRSSLLRLQQQDVGYDGLASVDEARHPRYSAYLAQIKSKLLPHLYEQRLQDPAGDNYRFALDERWDQLGATLRERYKYYLGSEGDASAPPTPQGISAVRTWEPDREDLNDDMQCRQQESAFRYTLTLTPSTLAPDAPMVSAVRSFNITMPDGSTQEMRWYKIRVPLSTPTEIVGAAPSLRFAPAIRLWLSDFDSATHLRFAALRLVRSDWQLLPSAADASIKVLSLDEESDRSPVPYLLPEGLERNNDYDALGSSVDSDERSLALQLSDLQPNEEVTLYKATQEDLRHHRQLSLYVHAESPGSDPTLLGEGALEVFVRLGRDHSHNYYEYARPLTITPIRDGDYAPHEVWPHENRLSISLDLLQQLKAARQIATGANPMTPFVQTHGGDTYAIKGYPSLGEVTSIVLGVRSRSAVPLRGEVWFNELQAEGSRTSGGDALSLQGRVQLSDLAMMELHHRRFSPGFGQVESHVRTNDQSHRTHWDLKGEWQLGKFAPLSWGARMPLHFSYSRLDATPLYDPYSDDLLLAHTRGAQVMTHSGRSSLHLDEWHIAGGERWARAPKPWHLSNLYFTYRLDAYAGFSPQIQQSYHRQASSTLTYDYTSKDSPIGQQQWRWTSLMRRHYQYEQQLRSQPGLYHRFDWQRALHLKWQPISLLHLSFDTTTDALIDEPFTREMERGSTPHFVMVSDTIMRSLLRLGTTLYQRNSTSATLRLPTFRAKVLAPLTGSVTWQSHFNFDHAALRHTGHTIRQNNSLLVQAQYNTSHRLRNLAITLRQGWGSSLSSLRPGASAWGGLTFDDDDGELALPLSYMMGWSDPAKTFADLSSRNLLIDNPQSPRPLYWHRSSDLDFACTLVPFDGLRIVFTLVRNHQQRAEALASRLNTPRLTGSYALSAVGLRDFWRTPDASDGYVSELFREYQEEIKSTRQELEQRYHTASLGHDDLDPTALLSSLTNTHPDLLGLSFVNRYIAHPRRVRTLTPGALLPLPNWQLTLDLVSLLPDHLTQGWLDALSLRHRYRGRFEVSTYQRSADWVALSDGLGYISATGTGVRASSGFLGETVRQRDEFAPLIGADVTILKHLSASLQWGKSRDISLLALSARMLEQYRNDLTATCRLSLPLPALWGRAKNMKSDLIASYTLNMARTSTLLRDLRHYTSQSSAGIATLTSHFSLDYTLTQQISLRAFYDLEQRRPIVSTYSYPYRSHGYGVLLNITLTP